jgi:hypothetical protein
MEPAPSPSTASVSPLRPPCPAPSVASERATLRDHSSINLARKQPRQFLIRPLSALLSVAPDGAGEPIIPDREVRCQVRALRDALHAQGGVDWRSVRSALGRLRGLYLDQGSRASFSTRLVAALRRVVGSYPFLRHVKPMKEAPPCLNGGRDPRADHGYTPQHRARLQRLYH